MENLPSLGSRNPGKVFPTSQVQFQRLKGRKGKYSEGHSIKLYNFLLHSWVFFGFFFFKQVLGMKKFVFCSYLLWWTTRTDTTNGTAEPLSQIHPSEQKEGWIQLFFGNLHPTKKGQKRKEARWILSFQENAKLWGFEGCTVHEDLEEMFFSCLLAEYPREVSSSNKKAIPNYLSLPTPCLLGTAWYWI